jgi:hypothetical protein
MLILGVTTCSLVVDTTDLTEAIHEHLTKTPSGVTFTNGGPRADVKP